MSRTIAQHWKGTKAFLFMSKREKQGKPLFVKPEEAERRAAICNAGNKGRRCPANIGVRKSLLEQAEDAAIATKLDGRATSQDSMLGTCGICSCELRTLVHMRPEVIMHGAEPGFLDEHPSICWKHQFKNSP